MLRAWLELPAVPAAAKKLGEGGHDEQRNKTLVYGCRTSDTLLCLTARYSMFKRSHARRARIHRYRIQATDIRIQYTLSRQLKCCRRKEATGN